MQWESEKKALALKKLKGRFLDDVSIPLFKVRHHSEIVNRERSFFTVIAIFLITGTFHAP